MSLDNQGEQTVPVSQQQEGEVRSSTGSKKWIGAAAAVAVVAAVTLGGTALVSALGGGGAQPEDVLPASAIAFAKLDLNPSAGQKLAVFQLASKFPKAKVTSQDTSVKESTFGSFFTGATGKSSLGLDYKKDVEPWLGDRIGVGVFPDLDGDKSPEVGVAIAFTDRAAAKTALDKAIANAAKDAGTGKVPNKTGYSFTEDGYVIVSDTAAHASALAKAGKTGPLSKSSKSRFAEDVKTLGADQIGVAWTDIAGLYKAMPKDQLASSPLTMLSGSLKGADDPKNLSGRVVMGLHADPSFIEMTSTVVGFKSAKPQVKPGAATQGAMIASFPADVFGAFTATGLGKGVGVAYTSLTAGGDSLGIKPMLSAMGIDSATQIETLLGTETGLAVGGTTDQPEFAIRTASNDPQAASELARELLAAAQVDTSVATVAMVDGPKGILVGTGSGLMGQMSDPSGSTLGGTAAFKQVMPGFAKADVALYVNLAKLVPVLSEGKPEDAASLKPLSALGMTVTGTGDAATARLRVSFK
jgi:hypothetical protein